MGLGKLLSRRKDDAEKGRVSLTDLIDKELTRPREPFSFRRVRQKLDELQELLNGDFERDDFMKKYFELNDAVYAPPVRSSGVFHPSSLEGDCPRRLFYELSGVPESDSVPNGINGQLQRIFDQGTWWHTYIQNLLYRAGVLIKSEAPVKSKKKKLGGHADGILNFRFIAKKFDEDFVLEVKTINSNGYRNIKDKPKPEHVFQASIYANHLGINKIYFLYINKDTCDMTEHLVERDADSIKRGTTKMNAVLESIEEKKAPARICSNSLDKPAMRCRHCSFCFKDK